MGLAERIKEVMGDMRPGEFAALCKVSPASVTFWTNGATAALKADPVAHMEARLGYRASWIVLGTGPKKLGESEVEIPLSPDLKSKVLRLNDEQLSTLESVMRAHLGIRDEVPSDQSNKLQLIHGIPKPDAHTELQEGAGPANDSGIQTRRRHARKQNSGSPRKKGGGSA